MQPGAGDNAQNIYNELNFTPEVQNNGALTANNGANTNLNSNNAKIPNAAEVAAAAAKVVENYSVLPKTEEMDNKYLAFSGVVKPRAACLYFQDDDDSVPDETIAPQLLFISDKNRDKEKIRETFADKFANGKWLPAVIDGIANQDKELLSIELPDSTEKIKIHVSRVAPDPEFNGWTPQTWVRYLERDPVDSGSDSETGANKRLASSSVRWKPMQVLNINGDGTADLMHPSEGQNGCENRMNCDVLQLRARLLPEPQEHLAILDQLQKTSHYHEMKCRNCGRTFWSVSGTKDTCNKQSNKSGPGRIQFKLNLL